MCNMHAKPKRKKGFTLTEIISVIAIITACILLLTPFIRDIRRKAKVALCEENLQNIALGLKMYASEHQSRFPANLSELTEGGYVEDERVFDCPASRHAGDALEPDYHYTTGYKASSPSSTILVFDKEENHKGGKHVLYISGDIVWEKI